jgi:hypothetical protein
MQSTPGAKPKMPSHTLSIAPSSFFRQELPQKVGYMGNMSSGAARGWTFPRRNGASQAARKPFAPSARAQYRKSGTPKMRFAAWRAWCAGMPSLSLSPSHTATKHTTADMIATRIESRQRRDSTNAAPLPHSSPPELREPELRTKKCSPGRTRTSDKVVNPAAGGTLPTERCLEGTFGCPFS